MTIKIDKKIKSYSVQKPEDRDREAAAASAAAQLALDNAVPVSNIIKLTTFLTEDDDGDDCVRKARAKYLGEHRPASTAVFVRRLVDPAWKIEIDAVALLPADGRSG